MFDWNNVDTVLLDMDGTLLDLRFDNQFWLEQLPVAIARKNNISIEVAKTKITSQYNAVKGTLDWYCIDYWSKQTGIDIRQLKRSNAKNISIRIDVIAFLIALQERNIERVLLTNAHPDSLSLKMEQTGLDQHLDHLYSTHQFGHCKESLTLWQRLQAHHPFNPERTLFIDDNEDLLLVARQFGIRHVLGIKNPDSTKPMQLFNDCLSIDDYGILTKQLTEIE
ncbi:GMP/IMP nucleotidase [Psychromonas sp. MME2]|uniref:GMP/IMP nucleotidase n=1 Tax=unclassified Psychromonas TaxID=2614957 RepID=UPI00339C2848